MKSRIKTVCGLEKYEELSKRKGFLNQLRYYWFVLIASLRDIGKEETIKEEKCWSNKTFALHSGTLHKPPIFL